MRRIAIASLLVAPLWATAATNLITNGSFESGLAGWTVSGSVGDVYPAAVITYNSATAYPTGAFGEAVPVDNAVTLSPDAVGTKALYFVSDFSTQVVSQTFTAPTTGTYTFGLDFYLPANGYANAVDATIGVSVGSTSFPTVALSTLSATTWTGLATGLSLTGGTSYTVALAFTSNGKPAKDIVIDRVYLVSSVPEASTNAMLLAGLAGLAFVAARRKNQG
jgi:hypothetical protein